MANLKSKYQRLVFQNAKLKDCVSDLVSKLEFVGNYMETEDGVFTFPDGDYITTKKKNKDE